MRGEQLSSSNPKSISLGSPPLARGTVVAKLLPSATMGITPACAGNRCIYAARVVQVGDHPRLRGEQWTTGCTCGTVWGSPPLARGTDVKPGSGSQYLGITPACAGNRIVYHSAPTLDRDHPRLRGEQSYCGPLDTIRIGSPPLARGTGWRFCIYTGV